MKWILLLSALFNYGYMLVDGLRGFIVGDYFRPQTGEYAGQLGPWSKVVSAIGIDPESGLMKSIFIVLGLLGLSIAVALFRDVHGAKWAFLAISLLSLFYLVPGTFLSVLQLILLGLLWRKMG